MQTFKLTLAYDGGAYSGWQLQTGQRTLQGALEEALEKITGEFIRCSASGRTDAGVHALGQVVSFRSTTQLPADTLQRALNAELPRDMAALAVVVAADDFHARRDAKRKTYRYVIDDGPVRDVFRRTYAWQARCRLNAEAMQEAALLLVGTHDFSSFETSGSPRESNVRTVYELKVARPAADAIFVEITANGFLYNMVRAIVGTLAEVGRGVQPVDWVPQVLAAADRCWAGQTAPAQGLFLVDVVY